MTWTGRGVVLLAMLGGLGVISFASSAIARRGAGLPALMIALLFFIILGIGVIWWRTGTNPLDQGIGRVIFSTLAIIGVVIAVPVLVAFAAAVILFAVCASQAAVHGSK